MKFICWNFNKEYGQWWLGVGRWRLFLKAPWCEPLFSERYGMTKHFRLGGGWRIGSRMIRAGRA